MIRRHLALKLGLALGLLVLIGLGAATCLLIHTASRSLLQQAVDGALDTAHVARSALRHEMLEGEGPKTWEVIFSQMMRETEMEALSLYAQDGRLVASSRKGKSVSSPASEDVCRSCHASAGLKVFKENTAWIAKGPRKEEKLRAVFHIANEPACHRCHSPESGLRGVLVADVSLAPARAMARKMLARSALMGSGLFLLLGLCLAWLVKRLVHRPLNILERSMGRLAAGELQARVPALGEDEIGHLAEGFNSMAGALQEKVQRLEALATTDYLTGLLNHRGFQERLKAEVSRARRYWRPFSLLMLDIDHFKAINDACGHRAGDEVLKQLADLIRTSIRESDISARYGGLLLWGLGNEYEGSGDDSRLWQEVERLARAIKRIDPNHPVITVVAEVDQRKIASLKQYCPTIDALGINSYGGLLSLPERLKAYGWDKPYIVTEFGCPGPHELGRTPWRAPVEPSSTEVASRWLTPGLEVLNREVAKGQCLGYYAYLWGVHKEFNITDTWYQFFLRSSRERLGSVDSLIAAWQGKAPANRVPKISALRSSAALSQVAPGQRATIQVDVSDPDGDTLCTRWIVREEKPTANQLWPSEYPTAIIDAATKKATLVAPQQEGAYRLYVYVSDGRGSAATANFPFLVGLVK